MCEQLGKETSLEFEKYRVWLIKTLRGHYSPKLAQNAPDYEVLNVTVKDEYYDILVVCYSCDEWAGSTVDITSTEQSMIYSMQVHQKMQTSDKEAHIKMHTDYSTFFSRS